MPRRDVQDFIAHWSAASPSERANSQPFLLELCDLLEVPRPDAHSGDGYFFEFPVTERHADGTTSEGRIDLYKRAGFILESKQFPDAVPEQSQLEFAAQQIGAATKRKKSAAPVRDTDRWDDAMLKALVQAQRYARALPAGEPYPPFLIVVDVGHAIEIRADFSLTGRNYLPFPDPLTYRIRLEQLRDEKIRARLKLIWTKPLELNLAKDISPGLLSDFLDHLEAGRANTARTRNLRLTAIRSFFRFAVLETPDQGAVIQRVLAIPNKRCQRPLVGFLTRPEIEALLGAVNRTKWIGRRDYAFLLVALQTGLRLSELTGIRREDVTFGAGAHIHCMGKGRKERGTPITKTARRVLESWTKEPWPIESAFLFPSMSGGRLSADAVQDLVNKHVAAARAKCSSLVKKRVTPHVLRHTAAMELLQAGVDRSMIALWLGHESVETTQIYLNANLALKEEILAKVYPINGKRGRYRPPDRLLSFLSNL